MSLNFAKSIHDFNILSELGRGGYSIVYLARHKKTSQLVALKAVNKIIDGKKKTNRVKREIKVLLRLDHPNIIKLFDWFETRERIYLVLEYVEFKDLYYYIRSKSLSEPDIISITRQIALSIKYCHDKGIIHRDVKLHNVLIGPQYQVKLSDFGLCTVKEYVDDVFKTNAGTFKFKAPEIIQGYRYNEAIDIWSFGVLLYYLITRKYPFNATDIPLLEKEIVKGEFPIDHPNLTSSQIDLLKGMLTINPHNRFTIDKVLTHPWLSTKKAIEKVKSAPEMRKRETGECVCDYECPDNYWLKPTHQHIKTRSKLQRLCKRCQRSQHTLKN